MFEGVFVDNKKQGKGLFTWPDGRAYDGEWLNGKQHGMGMYINAKKIKRLGEWNSGKRVQWVDGEGGGQS